MSDAPLAERFTDEDGFFLSPDDAAAHAVLVQKGFSTPEIEAERMIRAGGVQRRRALAWQVTRAAGDDVDRVRSLIRDALAAELLDCFGITVQDDQGMIADVFMQTLWPMIEAYGAA